MISLCVSLPLIKADILFALMIKMYSNDTLLVSHLTQTLAFYAIELLNKTCLRGF